MSSRYSQPTILMCRPEHYGIEYEINPWMSRARPADRALALAQWEGLVELLESLGAQIALQPAIAGLPDLVFTANAGLVHKETVFLSNFRHEARQGETPHDAEWFAANGFQTIRLPDTMDFEGAGDALFCGQTLYAGYHFRSSVLAAHWVAEQIGSQVIPLQLVSGRYYHLDTCFCPLDEATALYFDGAFDEYGKRVLQTQIPNLIPVDEQEAAQFACNAVILGRNVLTNLGCPRLHEELRNRGFQPWELPLGEFLKAGGSAKCLTLRLDGEEGASWTSRRR